MATRKTKPKAGAKAGEGSRRIRSNRAAEMTDGGDIPSAGDMAGVGNMADAEDMPAAGDLGNGSDGDSHGGSRAAGDSPPRPTACPE